MISPPRRFAIVAIRHRAYGAAMQKARITTVEFVALFSLLTSLTAISLDAVLPALPAMGDALAVADANTTQLIVTMFIFGMVFGELLFGPLCDAIGRKAAILLGLALFCVGAVIAMTAQTMEQILIGRIIQGIGVSGPKIGSRALIRDRFAGEAMAQIMSLIFTVLILVPMVAPAIGQLLLTLAGWQAIFVLYLAAAVVGGAWLTVRQPETLPPERRIPIAPRRLFRNAVRIMRHSHVLAYTGAAGLTFGAQLLFLSTAQSMFADIYGRATSFPFYFAVIALAVGIAAFTNSRLVMGWGMARMVALALYGLGASSGLLLLAALITAGAPPFHLFMALLSLMFFCVGILFSNLNALAMVSLGEIAGLGAALIASVSSLIAVGFAVSLGWFYAETVTPVALGFLAAALGAFALTCRVRYREDLPVVPIA
ncbi:multidrug effflux MFS transporter [Aliiroseovarius sp. YM-037]|uniref:multidrug effflux MFS transporter n=1 Tax=Aliiroseovarius sp. YM-037 TaxID=3341728 RepID=UPI003A7F9636